MQFSSPLINHIGLTVTNLEASIRFYTEAVGMTLVRRGIKTGGDWFDTLTDNSGAIIDAAMLKADQTILQLVQYHEGGDPRPATGHNRVGNFHMCVNVNDVDAAHSAIQSMGDCRPTPIIELPIPAARSFYVRDPDGVPIEFLQEGTA